MTSELSGFYRLGLRERRARIAELIGLEESQLAVLSGELGLQEVHADRMVENAVGVFGLPLGVCVNLLVDGREVLVPMAVEEPSVVAASSHAAKLLRAGGGLATRVSPPHMVGQIQILDVPDRAAAERRILDEKPALLESANRLHRNLVAHGGGAFDLEVRHLPPGDDPLGWMMVVHLIADVRDAMGANAINTMCEYLAPEIEALSGGRVGLRILSNLTDRRTVLVTGQVPFAALEGKGAGSGRSLAHRIEEASVFAERDPYRAATHNKGIMNGVDAVLIALGQDFRAVEAGAHAFSARSGKYTALARWRVEGGALTGTMEIPMAVGTVGGIAKVHPTVEITRAIARVEHASQLAGLAASVGLAQNLAAIRALAAEGIQSGHMRLHARNIAVEAGAADREIEAVANRIADAGTINLERAKSALVDLRGPKAVEPLDVKQDFEGLAAEHMTAILSLIDDVVRSSSPTGSSLCPMLDYHMETGGKRLRALTPLLVAKALGRDPAALIPLGAACEMLHNATLVHDDLQDGDTTRRGKATIWAQYGMPQAVNLGDAMFYYTVLLAQRLDVPAVRREAVARRVLVDTLCVIDGQEREFALKKMERITLADYFAMVEGKTSGLFALPMAGAAEVLGLPRPVIDGLAEAARHLGVLFQIQDDVLDLFGDKGRDMRGSDVAEGKRSALAVHAMEHASAGDRAWLVSILDKPREETSEQDVRDVMAMFVRLGSLDAVLDEVRSRRARATSIDALAAHPRLVELVGGLADLFLRPIATLLESKEAVLAELAPSEECDLAFCHEMLPEVSRTFALSIHALPDSLRNAVAIAYLLCRIVDTIEDEAGIDPEVRVRLFDAFDRILTDDRSDPAVLEQLSKAVGLGQNESEQRLMTECGRVFRAYRSLDAVQVEAIRPHVFEMSAGMREYTARADRAGRLILEDMEDLERYCYFVAGTVGNLLTGLFEHTVPVLDERVRSAIRERAVAFGLGLQMVNIVKDVSADFVRGDVFLPLATAKEHGIALDELLAPQKRQEALQVVRAVCSRARLHLERAAEYTTLWPAPLGRSVRQFCGVPLALALASLVEVEAGHDTLRPNRVPKISREAVATLFADVTRSVDDDRALMELFERCVRERGATVDRDVHVPTRPPSPPVERIEASRAPERRTERPMSGRILVTGARSHLGTNVVRHLLERGHDVRVLLRHGGSTSAMEGLGVERLYGDLEDRQAVEAATRGIGSVFHLAPAGTEHLVATGVERIVAVGASEADRVVLRAALARGKDVVMASVAPILGPNDHGPSKLGKTLLDYAHGRLDGYAPGRSAFTSSVDAASGLELVMTKGTSGAEYFLATEEIDTARLLDLFEEVSGRARPRVRLPGRFARMLGKVVPTIFAPPAVRGSLVAAERDLGYRPTSLRPAVHDAYMDFVVRGLAPSPPTMRTPSGDAVSGATEPTKKAGSKTAAA
jgi:hydroxymethylglutaryl-CoA reductase